MDGLNLSRFIKEIRQYNRAKFQQAVGARQFGLIAQVCSYILSANYQVPIAYSTNPSATAGDSELFKL